MLTANNPQVASGVVIYNFEDREFKGVPGSADEHVSFAVSLEGSVMHTESEDAAEQHAHEKEYRSQVEERRRDLQRAAQEEGKPELTEADLEDDLQVGRWGGRWRRTSRAQIRASHCLSITAATSAPVPAHPCCCCCCSATSSTSRSAPFRRTRGRSRRASSRRFR